MKILILSSSAGNGHNSAGNKIKEKFLKEDSSHVIEFIDAYKEFSSKTQAWIIEKGYYFACNNFVDLYNLGFKQTEHNSFENKNKYYCHKTTSSMWHGILKKIYEFKPDLIISTYIFISVALENLKRVYPIPAKIACMTLDYGVSPYWECTANAVDYMFLTNESMIQPFIERGFNKDQLFVSGIPVSQEFKITSDNSKQKLREELGLDKNLFTLIIMKASFFPIKEKTIIKILRKINQKIQVIIINGNSGKSKKKLDKLVSKANLPHKIINLNFTPIIAKYLQSSDVVLGKAGGLTISEIIASNLPSILVSKLPKQEIYNKEYLCQKNCAIALNGNDFSKVINELLEDSTKLEEMKRNLSEIPVFESSDIIYSTLKNIEKANYSNIPEIDDEKNLIKKINHQRKIDHKTYKNQINVKRINVSIS